MASKISINEPAASLASLIHWEERRTGKRSRLFLQVWANGAWVDVPVVQSVEADNEKDPSGSAGLGGAG